MKPGNVAGGLVNFNMQSQWACFHGQSYIHTSLLLISTVDTPGQQGGPMQHITTLYSGHTRTTRRPRATHHYSLQWTHSAAWTLRNLDAPQPGRSAAWTLHSLHSLDAPQPGRSAAWTLCSLDTPHSAAWTLRIPQPGHSAAWKGTTLPSS
jgi:hypothetical protein